MSLLKKKKTNTAKVVASVVGGAVAAGVAYLATTKKGKAMVKDAKEGVTSLIKSSERRQKSLGKKVTKTIGKARKAVIKAKSAVPKSARAKVGRMAK